ncbi:MAG: hypothetical protein KF856_12585 [Cyclobacteriaceae bacterium]|nr:hypothetical protein [Cyclobacteriaceae bacterium]
MKPLVALCLVVMGGCAGFKNLPKYQLQDDFYLFHQPGQKPARVFVNVKDDSIVVTRIDQRVEVIKGIDEFFKKRSLDIDVMSIAFKYRPTTFNFPRQLNSNFNGNIFVGYRVDRFWLDFKNTPAGTSKQLSHRAFTVGAFGGIGNTFISPWTTGNRIADEYDGFILSRGLATMIGLNNLTVGIALGWDYLTDRDKSVWIYQNKPWMGLTVGLNIN